MTQAKHMSITYQNVRPSIDESEIFISGVVRIYPSFLIELQYVHKHEEYIYPHILRNIRILDTMITLLLYPFSS